MLHHVHAPDCMHACLPAHVSTQTEACDYCDTSCVMGYCCSLRCYNTAHAAQLGWAQPAAILTAASMAVGQTVTITLTPQPFSSIQNVVIVQVGLRWVCGGIVADGRACMFAGGCAGGHGGLHL